ncbi:hypothetical protein HG530_006768 [Fusarium avenaceum]|nr:hypothetical protein HG530_006768 [Fusarium avenaceum]
MAEFTNNLRTIALQRPYDPESQRRAQAAVDLYRRFSRFPPLLEPKQPTEIHQPRIQVFSLPIEIYRNIIQHATVSNDIYYEKDHGLCLHTIFALTRTCRVFQEIVEEFLYKQSGFERLADNEYQFLFRFSLAVEPRRGRLVQKLDLYWHHQPSNSQLMIDTARACPNFSTLNLARLYRAKSSYRNAEFYNQKLGELAKLLDTSPSVTSFHFKLEFLPTREVERYPVLPNEKRFVKFAQQLTDVKLYGYKEWFQHAVLPHLSSSLTSFSITANDALLGFFPQLWQQSPALQRLHIATFSSQLKLTDEIIESIRLWGPTLRRFHLDLFSRHEIELGSLLPWMPVLEELILGDCNRIGTEGIMDIARASLPRLRTIDLGAMNYARPERNAALVEMISRHAATIQQISFSERYKMDIEVLRSLKLLKNLEVICTNLDKEIQLLEVEQLLAACPKLKPTFPAENYWERVVKEHKLMAGDAEKYFFNTDYTFRTWGSSCFGELERRLRK